MPTPSNRCEKLDIRITPEAKQILQEAAKQRHTTISQFVLESALDSASAVLVERSRLTLDRRGMGSLYGGSGCVAAPSSSHGAPIEQTFNSGLKPGAWRKDPNLPSPSWRSSMIRPASIADIRR